MITAKKFKSCLSLIMAFIMVVGVFPMSVIANTVSSEPTFEELFGELLDGILKDPAYGNSGSKYDQNGDGKVNYVSLGDSLTAGYGMDGYYPYWDNSKTVAENLKDAGSTDIGVFTDFKSYLAGYGIKDAATYPYLLNKYFNGDDLDSWSQMAVSSMRTEEFAYMITGGQYNGKAYPMDNLSSGAYLAKLLAERDTYLEKIGEAEVISILLGDYGLSSALAQRLDALMGTGAAGNYNNMTTEWLFKNFPEYAYLEKYYDGLYEKLEAKLIDVIGGEFGGLVADVADGLVYYAFSYVISNSIAMKEIHKLNPDAKLVVLGMSNFASGLSFEVAGRTVDISKVFEVLVDFVNVYRAVGEDNADCIFVDVSSYDLIIDEMARGDMDGSSVMRLMVELIKSFNIKDILYGTVDSMSGSINLGDLNSLKPEVIAALKNDLSEAAILQLWWNVACTGTNSFDALSGTKALIEGKIPAIVEETVYAKLNDLIAGYKPLLMQMPVLVEGEVFDQTTAPEVFGFLEAAGLLEDIFVDTEFAGLKTADEVITAIETKVESTVNEAIKTAQNEVFAKIDEMLDFGTPTTLANFRRRLNQINMALQINGPIVYGDYTIDSGDALKKLIVETIPEEIETEVKKTVYESIGDKMAEAGLIDLIKQNPLGGKDVVDSTNVDGVIRFAYSIGALKGIDEVGGFAVNWGNTPDEAVNAFYGLIEAAIAEAKQIALPKFDEVEDTIVSSLAAIWDVMVDIADCPEVFSDDALNDALALVSGDFMGAVSNEIMNAVTDPDHQLSEGVQLLGYLWLRVYAGAGLMGHPGETGHEEIYNAIVDALENNYTGKDYVTDLAVKLHELVKVYGSKALDKLLEYAEEKGILSDADGLLDRLNAKIAEWKADLATVGGNVEELYTYCEKMVNDVVELADQFGIAADAVLAELDVIVDGVTDVLAATRDDMEAAIFELISTFGSDVVDAVIAYAETLGYVGEVEGLWAELTAKLEDWKALIENACGPTEFGAVAEKITADIVEILEVIDVEAQTSAVAAFFVNVADIFTQKADELALNIYNLIVIYGEEAFEAIMGVIEASGALDDVEEFKALLSSKYAEWGDMLADAKGNVAEIKAICLKIANQLFTYAERYNVEGKAAYIAGVIAKVANTYGGQLVVVVAALVGVAGAGSVYLLLNYLNVDIDADDAKELLAKVKEWASVLETRDPAQVKAIAKEIVDYLISNAYITEAQADRVISWAKNTLELYRELKGTSKEEFIANLKGMIKAYGKDALVSLCNYIDEAGILSAEKSKALLKQMRAWLAEYEKLAADGITEDEIKALAEEVWNYLIDNEIIPVERIKEAIEWAKAEVCAYIEELKAEILALLSDNGKLCDLTKETVAQLTEKLEELVAYIDFAPVEEFIDYLVERATKTDYIKGEYNYYLALGASTAYGMGISRGDKIYSDIVAEYYGFDSDNRAQDFYIENSLEYLTALTDEIAKATLITYQQDADLFLFSLFNAEPNWSEYLSDDVISYAETVISEVVNKLEENVDPETLEDILPLVEKFAFGALEYAVSTIQGIEYINSFNHDATIILPGMYNPARGIKLDINGTVIDLEMIFDYIVDATNVYYIACGNLFCNVTFVDVSDAETVVHDTTISLDEVDFNAILMELLNILDEMYATAAGHEYIAEQIIGAINVVEEEEPEVPVLGDVNLDGIADSDDAVLILQYIAGLLSEEDLEELCMENGDVNSDGSVDSDDAVLILQTIAGLA